MRGRGGGSRERGREGEGEGGRQTRMLVRMGTEGRVVSEGRWE